MQITQEASPVSDPTLAKLLEVDSDLAAQEATLMAQLQEIQVKRSSLKTVVSLFTPEEGELATPATQLTEAFPSGEAAVDELTLVAPLPEISTAPSPSDDGVTQAQRAQPPTARKTRATARRTRGTTKATAAPASSRETKGWRPYVREEFAASAVLPEVTTKVLQRLPGHVFEVPEIMNAIFVDEIPKEVYKKARGRLLSVLSRGVKENKWQRGDKGQYSSSASGAEVEEV